MHCLYYQKKATRLEKTDGDEMESGKGDDGEVIKSLEDNDDRRNIDYKI